MLDFDAKTRIQVILKELKASDTVLVRFVEDLVVLLVNKKIVLPEEIPKIVRDRVVYRRALRSELAVLKRQTERKQNDGNNWG